MENENTTEKRNRSMTECNRCGFNLPSFRERITLCGIYEAILCVDCQSEWNLFCKNHETYKQLVANVDEYNTVIAQVGFDGKDRKAELAAIRETETELAETIFSIAEAWVNDRIERDKPEPVPPPTPEEILEENKKMLARYERRVEYLRESVRRGEQS